MTDQAERWRRVEQLCASALERTGVERAAFLRDACGDDEALKHEVEQLLVPESQTDGFLEGLVAAVAAEVMSPAPGSLTGQRLNGLEIAELIGAGGMGEVYKAHDSRLGRDVAIKVLPSVFAGDPERLRRFEHEARAIAGIEQSNGHLHLGDGAGRRTDAC